MNWLILGSCWKMWWLSSRSVFRLRNRRNWLFYWSARTKSSKKLCRWSDDQNTVNSTKDKCLKACGRWAAWMVQILISFREGCKKRKENHLLLKMQWNNKTYKVQHQGYLIVILGTISRAPSPVHIINPCVFASTVSFHL